jgi:hypothetical protein
MSGEALFGPSDAQLGAGYTPLKTSKVWGATLLPGHLFDNVIFSTQGRIHRLLHS